ncbi:MAG: site-specific integrase [Proteobacteria bacterium]|nr:site-specific integrase [Pseudomonadota bacterium]
MAYFRKREGKRGTRWQATIRKGGQKPQTQSFRTKGEAKAWATAIEAAINQGQLMPSKEAKRRTVRDLLERYKETELPKKKDQINTRRHVDFWINEIGDMRLLHLRPSVIVEIRDKLAKDKAPATIKRYLAALSRACTLAEREWEWMDSNPVRRVSRPSEPAGRARYLSDDERKRLLDAVKESAHPHLYAIVLIALTSGARRGEILKLRWKDVDLSSKRAVLHDTKNKERRTLTLVPQVVDELKKLQKVRRIDDDLIFVDTDTGKHRYFYFEKDWRLARDKAELEDFRFHDLRHSCASYLAMNGATTAELAAVLGHKTLAMVKRYSHLSDEHVRGVVERTAAKIFRDA